MKTLLTIMAVLILASCSLTFVDVTFGPDSKVNDILIEMDAITDQKPTTAVDVKASGI